MRVDQLKVWPCTIVEWSHSLTSVRYQDFLKAKSVPVSGKKADLIERVAEWFDAHWTWNWIFLLFLFWHGQRAIGRNLLYVYVPTRPIMVYLATSIYFKVRFSAWTFYANNTLPHRPSNIFIRHGENLFLREAVVMSAIPSRPLAMQGHVHMWNSRVPRNKTRWRLGSL